MLIAKPLHHNFLQDPRKLCGAQEILQEPPKDNFRPQITSLAPLLRGTLKSHLQPSTAYQIGASFPSLPSLLLSMLLNVF